MLQEVNTFCSEESENTTLTNNVDTTLPQVSAISKNTSLWNWTTYHLLSDHDDEAGKGSAPHARNGEQLSKACEVVGLAHDTGLNLQLAVHVVEVAGGLDLMVAETQEGLVRFLVAVLLHIPSWRSMGKGGSVQIEVVP